jgi:hypothetical protein
MIVRKARGKNKFGKIILSPAEIILAQRLGIPVEDYVKEMLVRIAKERKWKWFFKTRRTTNASPATKT